MSNLLSKLTTEQVNEHTRGIDRLSTLDIVRRIHEEDRKVTAAVEAILPDIAAATDLIIAAFKRGGRMFYVGAGTSGRLGILDASECPPTFGTDPSMVQGIIAGGDKAIRDAVEGAEDHAENGASDLDERGVTASDVVVGIAASGRTPYVLGAMRRAKELGASVIGLCNNLDSPMRDCADLMLEAVVGPEVVLGSTRMKSGTAQKMILNMLTTTAMIRIGKVYDNLMVDLVPTNEKLVYRSKRIIRLATGANDDDVNAVTYASGGHVKTAIVMLLAGVDAARAGELLAQGDGFVRQAVELAAQR
ncbi:N-acetylmuramic acid-6-phosphate etherase [Gordoniibacillus kamchatkensis]|uniref:N-acetylmuramic acid 6-phosphate etherase n=1 Tax=Gordoniibacillus kamchatkensis TaxID=1590651 RepID=A0ABR5AN55_9BACL|nr:N-acetylmuramic acid 6-phosphate etherase [Paenibacillus sp. VKM B-2647]KIL42395.1 N-acetylmuramic acid-6-phosphate etherase [Paenibacillus sp. VKM B-2647]